MSTGEGRKVTFEDTEMVKNLIEQCMVHYMNQKEIIYILYQQQKIEPAITQTVWQRLEDQNQEFFKAYHLRVILKEQITKFNYLLEKQAAMMNHLIPNDQVSYPSNNGSNIPPLYHVPTDLPSSSYHNGGPSGMQHASDYEVNMLLAQNANDGNIQEMNNVVRVKNEPGYSQNESIDNASVASSNNMDLNPHQFNGTPSNVIHQPNLLPNPDNSLDAHGTIVGNQGDNRSPHNPLTNSQKFEPEEQLQSQRSNNILSYDPNSQN